MEATKKLAHWRPLRTLTLALVPALLTAAILGGAALAAGHEVSGKGTKPGVPTPKAPRGSIASTTPTFTWSKARGGARYEVRVYDGNEMLLRKTGITRLSWTSSSALAKDVSLAWKVRASSAGGTGAWSRSLTFRVLIGELAIGDSYQGGKVAYILQPDDPGYVAGETHGLIAATADESDDIPWWNGSSIVTDATATTLGAGLANTNKIIAAQGATATSYAAGLARAYDGGGYRDWYQPSKDELNELYLNRASIGGFGYDAYWSSSEIDAGTAWWQWFDDGRQESYVKDNSCRVRPIRSF